MKFLQKPLKGKQAFSKHDGGSSVICKVGKKERISSNFRSLLIVR